MNSIIFTLVGKDKPGLVESLAQTVYKLDGNWLSSNFSHMAGHFAGFVEIELPQEKLEELVSQFEQHPDLQIHLVSGESADNQQTDQAVIEIMGNDKPGIVQELTSVLSQFNINIIQFDSSIGSAPNWGSSLFKAKATIAVAPDFDLDPLREALEQIANDLVVDVTLE